MRSRNRWRHIRGPWRTMTRCDVPCGTWTASSTSLDWSATEPFPTTGTWRESTSTVCTLKETSFLKTCLLYPRKPASHQKGKSNNSKMYKRGFCSKMLSWFYFHNPLASETISRTGLWKTPSRVTAGLTASGDLFDVPWGCEAEHRPSI